MIKFVSETVQVHVASYFEEIQATKYLVLKRSQNVKVYPGIWQVITGTIEGDETALSTALRETMEEIGCKPIRMWTIPYITRFFNPKNDTIQASPVFGMIIDSRQQIKLSDEHEKYEWLHLDMAIEKLLLPSHRDATNIFNEFIINAKDKSLFEINLTDKLLI
ncbi:MAG: NUDIX domain-containing protein [Candidatus Kapabacteria bacterium]|nr:NUDIX domain-containing protein [Ignavibacteriota bacterium]MCW5883468.1 NUDIX domain-containing protein [Candidatus Kapabacteria bacterium]